MEALFYNFQLAHFHTAQPVCATDCFSGDSAGAYISRKTQCIHEMKMSRHRRRIRLLFQSLAVRNCSSTLCFKLFIGHDGYPLTFDELICFC